MTFTIPVTTPSNALRTDYGSGEMLGVQSGTNFTYYTQDDLFMASPPANLCTNLFSGSVTLSNKFMGIHVNSSDASSGITLSTVRSHDQAPYWAQLNPSSGVFTDAGLRTWLSSAKANGAEVIYTLHSTPTWASARPAEGNDAYGVAGGLAEPASMTSLSSFITWLMQNYGSQIDYIEIWNEPKYKIGSSSYFSGTPAKLAEMARTINLAAKAVKPSVQIMGCGATGVTFTDGLAIGVSNSGIDITNFFLQASDNNAGTGKQWIDILSVHTYDHSGSNLMSNLETVNGLITTLKSNNAISSMPVWSTEYGYITPSFSNYTGPSIARMQAYIRYVMMNVVMGMSRCVMYSYGSNLGWQKDSVCNSEWNRWANIINGSTVTRINRVGTSGQLACVIKGQNYLI